MAPPPPKFPKNSSGRKPAAASGPAAADGQRDRTVDFPRELAETVSLHREEAELPIGDGDSEGARAAIRDAAFRGLLGTGEEFEAIEVGLAGSYEVVKMRALSALGARLRAACEQARNAGDAQTDFDGKALELLERALEDVRPSVRHAAATIAIEVRAGGDDERTLRLLLDNLFADVRHTALSCLRGNIEHRWAWQLLLGVLDDPDAQLRAEAFGYASERGKGVGLQHLAWVMMGPHAGLKQLAIRELSHRQGNAVRLLFEGALADADGAVRQAAIAALELAGTEQALATALRSSFEDVRIAAAVALARSGDSAALDPLQRSIGPTGHENDSDENREQHLCQALQGLAELGAPVAFGSVIGLLQDARANVRATAAAAMGWLCDPDDLSHRQAIAAALSHEDEAVRQEAAFGLAMLGDAAGRPVVEQLAQKGGHDALRAVAAAAVLSDAEHNDLAALFCHEDAGVRRHAARVRMLLEVAASDGSPDRIVGLFSSQDPALRQLGVRAAGNFAEPQALLRLVHELMCVGDRGRAGADLSQDSTDTIASVLAWSTPRIRGRLARLLEVLETQPDRFAGEWERFHVRFSAEVLDANGKAAQHRATEIKRARGLIAGFSAHGLRSMPPLSDGRSDRRGPGRVETTRRLAAVRFCTGPMFALAARDPDSEVRRAALRALVALGVDAFRLGLIDESRTAPIRILAKSPERAVAAQEPLALMPAVAVEPPTVMEVDASAATNLLQVELSGRSNPLTSPFGLRPMPRLVQIDPTGRATPLGADAHLEMQAREGAYHLLACPTDFVWMRRAPEESSSLSAAGTRVVRIAGQIASRSGVCDIVAFVAQSGWRGELIVTEGRSTRSIFFDAGNVVGAITNVADERIGQVMYRFGAVDQEQIALIEQQARQGVRFGWAAVQLGFVTQDKLYEIMGEQIRSILFATFTVSEGTFFFLDDFDEVKLVSRHSFSANGLLLDGLSRLDEMELFRRKISSIAHVPVRLESGLPLPDDCEVVFQAIDGSRNLEEIGRHTGFGEFQTYKTVYALLQSKHVNIVPPRVAGGLLTLIDEANQALILVHERVDAIGRGSSLRNSIAQMAARRAHEFLFRGAGPDSTGILLVEPLLENCRSLGDGVAAEATLQFALHDYVSSALFCAEGELGAHHDRELVQGVNKMLTVLRPRGSIMPPLKDAAD